VFPQPERVAPADEGVEQGVESLAEMAPALILHSHRDGDPAEAL